ncbi:MAG: hypothetical protein FJZ01_23860 [Candidatus Sericytochromatia bacterium]|nr:hypothetical protein [Candidatus Tanganyikabacteria bacterium]
MRIEAINCPASTAQIAPSPEGGWFSEDRLIVFVEIRNPGRQCIDGIELLAVARDHDGSVIAIGTKPIGTVCVDHGRKADIKIPVDPAANVAAIEVSLVHQPHA